jgi:diguanylate cyclase (GGDEF)-like protein
MLLADSPRAGRDGKVGVLDAAGLRAWIDDQLPRSLANGRSVAALYLDLDSFHLVNERHGLAVGDRVVSRWTELLAASLGPDDRIARVGGNELLIVLDRERAPDLEALLCAMRRDVRRGIALPDLVVEFSAGILHVERALEVGALLTEGAVRMARGRLAWRTTVDARPAPPRTAERAAALQ